MYQSITFANVSRFCLLPSVHGLWFLFYNRLTFHWWDTKTVLNCTFTFKSKYSPKIISICSRIWWWVPMTHDLCSLNENHFYVAVGKKKIEFCSHNKRIRNLSLSFIICLLVVFASSTNYMNFIGSKVRYFYWRAQLMRTLILDAIQLKLIDNNNCWTLCGFA